MLKNHVLGLLTQITPRKTGVSLRIQISLGTMRHKYKKMNPSITSVISLLSQMTATRLKVKTIF